MGKRIFRSGYIRVGQNQEIDLEPITLENETRGVIHGTVRGTEGKVCVAKLFKIIKEEGKHDKIIPVSFQYLDDWGQFLFPVVDTGKNVRYVVKVFCLDPEDCSVDPVIGTEHNEMD